MAHRPPEGLAVLQQRTGLLFAHSEIERYLDREERHDIKILTRGRSQALRTMSSGEQKKALLDHLLEQDPDFLILVNPLDHLDREAQSSLRERLTAVGTSTVLVQLVGRPEDILPGTTDFFFLEGDRLCPHPTADALTKSRESTLPVFQGSLPPPLVPNKAPKGELVHFDGVSVQFDGRPVLDRIHWKVEAGEFWQLIGPNGSGKTTLLSMITGDSHKGYGQELSLFGHKKGSGESVWDLKKNIGYFTPALTDRFRGYHSVTNMIISGLHDSIGLYVIPGDAEQNLADHWLKLLGMYPKSTLYFKDLSRLEQRMVMMARAMIKHPPLLILDEPTAGLDRSSASLLVALVNKIAQESDTAIIFVSHRVEPLLRGGLQYVLEPSPGGSRGRALPSP